MYSDINKGYTLTVRNKFNTLQPTSETHTPRDEYEKCVTAHIEAVTN